MKSIFYFLFCLAFLFAGSCKSDNHKTQDSDIVIGKIDSVDSKVLSETIKIWVYVPKTEIKSQTQRFPVIYLLDGDAHFYSVVGMIHQLSTVNGNTICPEMIIVGITNNDRNRDLTPSNDSTNLKTSGGGENFTSFIEKELIPYVDSKYPTASFRILIGHSFGGLMVINTLINHTDLFNSYLAIDPSMWWHDQKLLNKTDSALMQIKYNNRSLFLAIANTMDPTMDTINVKKDTSNSTQHIRSIFRLRDILEKNPSNGLKWDWKYYNREGHASVPMIAEYDAIHYLFDFYNLPQRERLIDTLIKADSIINLHFQNVSNILGYKVLPPESGINSLGYYFLNKKLYTRAYSLFKMNIENYPQSANVFDSMGELLMNKGDTLGAIENYEKSIAMYPQNENAKSMVRKMKDKFKEK